MSLKEGTRVGPYEIGALLGAGGMGEVYRARDTRLDRDAAVKILPDSFAADADRLARFEREAKTLAALNHPHIAAIYGLEDGPADAGTEGRTRVLAMELVEGEDLSQIIARGPLPLDEALPIARQIAEALEAAHAQGIIHRDLKPANIKVRADGTVKVLDFGLAKSGIRDQGSGIGDQGPGRLANSPTITSPAGMTAAGIILGTAAYMAPEQARGRVVDSRADVWAFGCVLFEMLTGHQAFDGEDITAVLAKVIEREPDWTRLPPRTPAIVTRLLHRALQKDRLKRLQHMGDARLDLDEALNGPVEETASQIAVPAMPASRWRNAVVVATTLAAGVGLGAIATQYWPRPPVSPLRAVQFDIPVSAARTSRFTLSPDSRYLAYIAPNEQAFEVWLRDLSRPEPVRLLELPNVNTWLTWSSDGRALLVGVAGGLRRFDPETAASILQPGSWPVSAATRIELSPGRFLVAGAGGQGSMTVEAQAGRERAIAPDPNVEEVRQAGPVDAGHASVIYRSDRKDGSRFVCVTRLDSAAPRCAGPVNHDSSASYSGGQLLYLRGGALIARPFDIDNARFIGEERSIAAGIGVSTIGVVPLAVREDAVAFAIGTGGERLAWRDRSGAETPIMPIEPTTNMSLSADGRRVLLGNAQSLVMLDLATGGSSRLGDSGGDVIWSPDGTHFAYRTASAVVTRAVDSPQERVVATFTDVSAFTEDWSPDGRWIAVGLRTGGYQAALLPVAGGEPVRFLKTGEGIDAADEFHFSPNGKWIAFNATSGGRSEVFIVANPPTSQRWQVSTRGGVQARWRPSTNTLHYLGLEGTMMEVPIQPGNTPTAGEPRPLFKIGFAPNYNFDDYRVAPDGRFLLKSPLTEAGQAIRVIVNWTALLGKQQ